MDGPTDQLLSAVQEIRDLLRLIAEPAIAERDQKRRVELRRIVGQSAAKGKVVLLMDGSRTQADIHRESGFNVGNLSTLVKQLGESNLLIADSKQPHLAISIPPTFFESGVADER